MTDSVQLITEDNLTLESILFAFDQKRERVPIHYKPHILMWHSALVHLIWHRRNVALELSGLRSIKVAIDFTGWKYDFLQSIRTMILKIYASYEKHGGFDAFCRTWVKDCTLWKMNQSRIEFTDPEPYELPSA
jgi:hypothetical protein